MLKVELLTLLYSNFFKLAEVIRKFILSQRQLCFLIYGGTCLFIFSCANVLTDEERKSFYIMPIPEERGIYLRNKLLMYFPNQDTKTTTYNVVINTTITDGYYLADKTGYGTKGRIHLNVDWIIVSSIDNSVKLRINNIYSESYNVEPSGFAIRNSRDIAINNITDKIASDIRLKIYGFKVRENKKEGAPPLNNTNSNDCQDVVCN